jgi:lipopolysaccharide transport system permease protein
MTPFNEFTGLLTERRQLIWEMAKREVSERYSGQVLGAVWAVGHPLIVIGVYLFVFKYVFRMAIGGTPDMPMDYAVYLLSGLIPWVTVQDVASKTTISIKANVGLVKQAVFPSEALPVKTVLASLFSQIVSITALLIYVLVKYHTVPWTYALIPVVFVLQLCWLVGVALILSSLGVFIRDLKDLVQVGTVIGLYLLPVFYLPTMVPDLFRPLLYVNPFSYLIWCYQDVFYFGRFAHPYAWVVFVFGGIGLLALGVRLFAKLKPAFGNVL